MDWFYKKDNAELGPLDDEAFATHILDGRITLDTMVWHVDMKEWIPLSEVIKQEGRAANHEAAAARSIEEAAAAPAPDAHGSSARAKILDPDEVPGGAKGPPPLPPPEARGAVLSSTRLKIQPRATSQPLIPDHLKKVIDSGAHIDPAKFTPVNPDRPASAPVYNPNAALPTTGAPPPPPFAQRLCADLSDVLLAAVLAVLIAWLAPASVKTGDAILFFLPALLAASFLPHALCILMFGATPGFLVMRLRLRTELGARCPLASCLAYPFGLLLSVSPLGLGLFTSVLTGERRPLHDMIAGTRAE